MVKENRAFIAEAVTWAASKGIGQFLDLGAGLPATPAVHQSARAVLPGAQVAYVDRDPMVMSHARALLAAPGVTAVAADLRDPATMLADPELRAVIDPAEPVCVILGAILHFLDAGTAREVTAGYARLIAPGSCLVISCATYDDETLAKRLAAEYTAGQFVNHTREDIVSFFAGLELVGPGVTEAQTWRAWMPQPVLRHREGHVLAGVARRQA
jgi:O-methyltransferase involved in polyketide biosynthesis